MPKNGRLRGKEEREHTSWISSDGVRREAEDADGKYWGRMASNRARWRAKKPVHALYTGFYRETLCKLFSYIGIKMCRFVKLGVKRGVLIAN